MVWYLKKKKKTTANDGQLTIKWEANFLSSEAGLQKPMYFFPYKEKVGSSDSRHSFPQRLIWLKRRSIVASDSDITVDFQTGKEAWEVIGKNSHVSHTMTIPLSLPLHLCERHFFGMQIANMKHSEISPDNLWAYVYGICWKHFRIKTRRIWGSFPKKNAVNICHTQTRLVPLVTNAVHGGCLEIAILYSTSLHWERERGNGHKKYVDNKYNQILASQKSYLYVKSYSSVHFYDGHLGSEN